jgi:hypothetical protein
MTPAARAGLDEELAGAGGRATTDAPLAWLHLEPRDTLASDFVVRLRQWPSPTGGDGGDEGEQLLAVSHPHGTWVRWQAA